MSSSTLRTVVRSPKRFCFITINYLRIIMATTKTRTTKPRVAKTVVADAVEKVAPAHHSEVELDQLADNASRPRLFATAAIGSVTYVGVAVAIGKFVAMALSLPTLSGAIWFLGFMLALVAGITAGTYASNRVIWFLVEKRDIALIDKARSFFDFRKGATA
jgi:hypothetical protein